MFWHLNEVFEFRFFQSTKLNFQLNYQLDNSVHWSMEGGETFVFRLNIDPKSISLMMMNQLNMNCMLLAQVKCKLNTS